jgi:ribonuclease P protein component
MLPFKNRLVKKKDFDKVHKDGQFFSKDNIAIKVIKNGLPDTRIGIIVGLRFSKKAVERNKMKREVRDLFQPKLREFKKGFDVMVIVRKKENERIVFKKLQENIKEVLERTDLLVKNKQNPASNQAPELN